MQTLKWSYEIKEWNTNSERELKFEDSFKNRTGGSTGEKGTKASFG